MSTNTNTDLTEEDAAALQFPKEKVETIPSTSKIIMQRLSEVCGNCSVELVAPYILCAVCEKNICSACFAKGAEFSNHCNNHSYRVLNDDFVLFEGADWTAKEELLLLDLILQLNNWNSIEKHFPNRSAKELKEHYEYYYLKRNGCELLPKMPEIEDALYPMSVVPYRFRLSGVEEPPRYTSNSGSYHSLAGYNAARSDFEIEYDANAEDLIANLKYEPVELDDPDYERKTDEQCAIVESYNKRLKERHRRKWIIRTHGLILLRKTIAALHRYDLTITRPVCERLLRFMQFYKSGVEFDYLMEGLHRAGELKIQISRLCEFRKMGIKTMKGIQLYLKLKKSHEESMQEVKQFQARPEYTVNLKNYNLSPAVLPPNKKKGTFTPIDIVGMPGFDKLLPKEMELCRNVRLVPMSYLELRDILIVENKKMGRIKLQTARRLLKIDVNKTRKLYDFLVQEGYIAKPS